MEKSSAKQIAKIIKKSDKIAFFHHINPDGDSLSCSYGMIQSLKKKFPNKEIKWIADKEYLKKANHYIIKNFEDTIETIDDSWTAIIGDTSVSTRVFAYDQYEKAGKKICFDHHMNSLNFKVDKFWSEPTLGASSIQALEILKILKVNFNSEDALASLYGILTDTYNYTYSLADTRPVKAGAELLKFINDNDIDVMYKQMKQRTLQQVRFQAWALTNFIVKGKVAYLIIKESDMKHLKVIPEQVKRVNLIGNIEGIKVWAFFTENKKDKYISVSLRSLGVKVNEIASEFGGGGHNRAAGIKLPYDFKQVDKVIAQANDQINKSK
ncbi:MAG: bifunctional oligoribonuclease/PAP phosphatase NrnA [Mycoplasmataceae bacterium]|nr:bifunctional oligoribonuclease/PAP phosphatase NrnA [Mycoplasmataceae bacterium]